MISAYVRPRLKKGVPCDHAAPELRKPWWSYACAEHSPDCWQAFTEPDFRDDAKRPEKVNCPLCLWDVRYEDGVMRRHREDQGEDCRCSGLSEQIAHRYVDALLAGKSLPVFVHESPKTPFEPVVEAADPEPTPVETALAARLAAVRVGLLMTQTELAETLGTARSALVAWELGSASPSLDSALRWATAVGQGFALTFGDEELLQVTSQAVTAWWMTERRQSAEFTVLNIARAVGTTANSVYRWESGKSPFRLIDLDDWAAALGLKLELHGKEEA